MKKFDREEVAKYYNHTLLHYQVGWNLHTSKGLHFGLWYPETKNLSEAIINMNEKVAQHFSVDKSYHVLDAGCGIGGTAMHLAKRFDCSITGITLK